MISYPIVGPYRGILLPLEIILIGIILEIAAYFFQKYLKNKKDSVPSIVEFDWGMVFLGFGSGYIFFIIGDFLYVNREIFLTLAYITISSCGLIYSYHMESNKIINSRYIFTLFSISMLIVYVMTIIFAHSMIQISAYITAFPVYILLIIYFIKVLKRIWIKYKLHSIGLFLGFIFWFLGFAATTDMAITLFNSLNIRIVGDLIILVGMTLLGFSLNTIPSLTEIGWKNQIKYIIISSRSGICLYNENFREQRELNENVLAGALFAIKTVLEKSLKNGHKLTMISKEKDIFLIEEGKFVVATFVVEQEFEILKYFLKKIVQEFEEFFREIFNKWTGESATFKPAKKIINKILSIEKIS